MRLVEESKQRTPVESNRKEKVNFSCVKLVKQKKMNRNNFRGKRVKAGDQSKSSESNVIVDNNPVTKIFREYAAELNDKHDRYERIVKISRDITIEAKRLIFLLHSIDKRKGNKDSVLEETKNRLLSLCKNQFANIAKELSGRDSYQYARAYSAGLQEFVEAFTYYDFMRQQPFLDWQELQKQLTYLSTDDTNETDEEKDDKIAENCEQETHVCLVQPIEFMLGLADLSGEVMRNCINSLGSGDIDNCFDDCKFMQNIYSG